MQIQVKNLYKTYRNTLGGIEREVLRGLNLQVGSGEKIAVTGPSGSGKTTLLNLIGTLDKPDKGEIHIGNLSLSDMKADQILSFRNRTAGFVFQLHHLLPQCTLLENVLLPTLPLKGDKTGFNDRAKDLLKLMGIWEQRDNKPGELSGGECQRAAVARALINQPRILLADEPTGSLDAKNADLLIDLLSSINKEMGITLLIATHAKSVSSRMDLVYGITEGKLALQKA
ncbi:MAG: ABC transporter ATP-binding protein [Bacteroidales bacterium]